MDEQRVVDAVSAAEREGGRVTLDRLARRLEASEDEVREALDDLTSREDAPIVRLRDEESDGDAPGPPHYRLAEQPEGVDTVAYRGYGEPSGDVDVPVGGGGAGAAGAPPVA